MESVDKKYLLPGVYLILSLSLLYVLSLSHDVGFGDLLAQRWHFFIIGVIAATAANSTGAGGGVVFIPAFNAAGVSSESILATSIAIQCFGMTAGSFVWLRRIASESHDTIREFKRLYLLASLVSFAGILTSQHLLSEPPYPMQDIFRFFSLFFGILILLRIVLHQDGNTRHFKILLRDYLFLFPVIFFGGMITAWISVGVGEFLAIYLIFRRVPTHLAVAIAVCVTSVSVLCAVYRHILLSEIDVGILLFAATGAIIGGTIAPQVAKLLGDFRLKLFFAAWILLAAIFG